MTPPKGALRRVGTELINNVAVPVYELPDGSRYVEIIDFLSNDTNLVSVEAAQQFRSGHYPISTDVTQALGRRTATAFAHLSEADQEAAAQALLSRVFERIERSHAHFNFMDN